MTAAPWYLDDWPSDDELDDREPAQVVHLPKRTSWTAAELMTVVFPAPRWAVPGILPVGLTVFAGAPKIGKSWLVLNLAVAIALGGKALGRIDVTGGDVLYLALEDNGPRLQRRLKAVLGDDPAPARLTLSIACEPLTAGGAERITEWLDAHPDARLVVVDVLARVRGTKAKNTDAYEADYAAMSVLKRIADDYNVAVDVVHHTRKAESADFLDTVSGSQGIAGGVDTVMVLTRSRGSAGAVLKITGRDVEEAELALNFDAPTGTWKMLDGPAGDYDLSSERRRILTVLRTDEGLAPKQIAEAAGVKYDVVKHLVRKMVDAGQLDTDGNGHYFPVHSVHSVHHERETAGQGAADGERPPTPPFTAIHRDPSGGSERGERGSERGEGADEASNPHEHSLLHPHGEHSERSERESEGGTDQ